MQQSLSGHNLIRKLLTPYMQVVTLQTLNKSQTLNQKRGHTDALTSKIRQKGTTKDSDINNYSREQILTDFNEVSYLQNNQIALESHLSITDQEPSPLYIDSMLPISADIEHLSPQLTTNKLSRKDSEMKKSIVKGIGKMLSKKQIYHKLALESEDEELAFTKQLRKMQEQKAEKVQAQNKAEKMEAELLAHRLKMYKNDRISYDYNGSQLKVRSENRNNLVSKLVNGSINTEIQKLKEAVNDPNPTLIEDATTLSKKKNIMNLTKRRDQVQFDGQRSLSQNVSVGGGVRYTFEGKTLTGQTNLFSTAQLKQAMHSSRRLSKVEFERVKSLNGFMFNPQEKSLNSTSSKLIQKSKSQHLFSKPDHRIINIGKIVVLNEKQKKKLMEMVQEEIQPVKRQQLKSEEKNIVLGFTDVFNMNYLKHKGQQTPKDEYLTPKQNNILLPKINHFQDSPPSLPKSREKIKQSMRVFQEIRKNFEEKLRT